MKLELKARLKFNPTVWLDTAIYFPKNNSIICVAKRQLIRTFDATTGIQIGKDMIGHQSRIYCLAYSLDQLYIASGSSDMTIRIWDAKQQQQLQCLQGHERSVIFLQFLLGKLMSYDGHNLIIWDISDQGRIILKLTMKNILYRPFCSLDCKLIISYNNRSINVWNTVKQKFSRRIMLRIDSIGLKLSPIRRFVAIPKRETQIHIFDIASGKMIRSFCAEKGLFVSFIQFQVNGFKIISNYADNSIRIWNTITGKQEFVATIEDMKDFQYTSDNQLMVVNSNEEEIMIYQLQQ